MADKQFKKKIGDALGNNVLRGALGRFGDAYTTARENAYEGYDFKEISENIERVKSNAASHLDEMLDQFERAATARGAKVYRATTGEDAKQYILELAKSQSVKRVVKSKSMASEEILLNKTLLAEGMDVQETDLGEWIVQLAGQHPSHMVLPAIHMTKEEVADTFTNHLNRLNEPEISELVKTARVELRKKFLEADMGISGANIAVAETGTLIMMTNEGNARLTATLPPVHVYLVGIEKIVPKFEDAGYIIQALPKSATGQKITSYVSMVTGQTPAYYSDGMVKDKEFHIILMDNGRRKMYEDEKFKKTFQCIRCASCLNVCPAFQLVGGHVYGHIYTGGIGTILTNFLNSEKDAQNPQNLCLQCGKCSEVCPGKLDIPEMILEIRNRMGDKQGLPFTQKFALDVVSNRRLFHSLLRTASIAQKPFSKGQPVIRHLPMFLSGLTEKKSLPTVAKVPFRDVFKTIKQDVKKRKGTIALYAGCLIDFVYPKIGEGMIVALNEKGYEVVFPDGQSCCGAPATYMGDRKNARKCAIMNIKALEAEKVDYVVTACPTCTHALIDSFKELLQDDPALMARAEELSRKSRDFSKLLFDLGGLKTGGDGEPLKVTYHDSCHLKRKRGVSAEPRKLLSDTLGVQLIEMNESDRCCGFAGSYSIKFPELSGPIMERKLGNIEATGADAVVVDCPGCLMQISGGLDKRNPGIKVIHTAELLLEKRKTAPKKNKK
ncbi:L-lactate dehydrogenase (quinone) large subunit LdhH [Desulfosporosinus sp. BG]|uniref:L-lactate dehydrogenase (quinone) large subunit LdhH n=1 Tax=Desulfosporosinus sp. BG TaxID=1633135 RepID=UPI00083A1ECB|nr:LUD domain-containing protein [Desulfosporosinus sp. BG]ODA41303.1 L-lactate dehydrogenase, Fe-S oxidoreductase subunit YkgE [Desulfosporosinus sp. BG]